MFSPTINGALVAAADLVNTAEGMQNAKDTPEQLGTLGELRAFLENQPPQLNWPTPAVTHDQLQKVVDLRATLRHVWESAPITDDSGLELLNELLSGVTTKLVRDEESGEQVVCEVPVAVSPELHHVIAAPIAMALAHLVVTGSSSRLRICQSKDCQAVLVDLTRNSTKRFCDLGNCANRDHVRAYRARQKVHGHNT